MRLHSEQNILCSARFSRHNYYVFASSIDVFVGLLLLFGSINSKLFSREASGARVFILNQTECLSTNSIRRSSSKQTKGVCNCAFNQFPVTHFIAPDKIMLESMKAIRWNVG